MAGYIRIDRKMVDKSVGNEWSKQLGGNTTVVITNDMKAQDQLLADMLSMTIPVNIGKCIIRTKAKASRIIRGEVGAMAQRPYYFIVNNLKDAAELCAEGKIDEVNLALLKANTTDQVKLNDFVQYDKADQVYIDQMKAQGVKVVTKPFISEPAVEL